MHDVVFENGGAAESAENADRENRDGNGSRDSKTGTEADVNRYSAEEQTEERTENDRAQGEFLERFFRSDVGAKFSWGRSGTPGAVAHVVLPRGTAGMSWKRCAGIMPQGEAAGKRILSELALGGAG